MLPGLWPTAAGRLQDQHRRRHPTGGGATREAHAPAHLRLRHGFLLRRRRA